MISDHKLVHKHYNVIQKSKLKSEHNYLTEEMHPMNAKDVLLPQSIYLRGSLQQSKDHCWDCRVEMQRDYSKKPITVKFKINSYFSKKFTIYLVPVNVSCIYQRFLEDRFLSVYKHQSCSPPVKETYSFPNESLS